MRILFYYRRKGEVMTNSVSNTTFQNQTPSAQVKLSSALEFANKDSGRAAGAQGLNANPNFTVPKENVVLNPPQFFYRFSVREAAHLDSEFSKNYMKTLLHSLHQTPPKKQTNKKKSFLTAAAFTLGGLALWCKRDKLIMHIKNAARVLTTKIPFLKG